MTSPTDGTPADETTRRATLITSHDDPDDATTIAGAVTPDNTDDMQTRVDGTTVRTTIERQTTGGLAASTDDYVVNLAVAERVVTAASTGTGKTATSSTDSTTNTRSNTPPNTDT